VSYKEVCTACGIATTGRNLKPALYAVRTKTRVKATPAMLCYACAEHHEKILKRGD